MTHPEIRDALLGKSSAIETLADIVSGRQLLVSGPTGKPIWRYPSFQERLTGLKILLDKCVPNLQATELTGAAGQPLFDATLEAPEDQRQLARAVVALLANGAGGEDVMAEAAAIDLRLSDPGGPAGEISSHTHSIPVQKIKNPGCDADELASPSAALNGEAGGY